MTRQEKKIGCHRSAGPSKHLLFLAGTGFRGCNSLPTRAILEGSMKYRRRFFLFLLLVSFPVQAAAQAKGALKLVATIPLPVLKDGDFDHFATDIDGHRLFLTDEENDKVDVLDTATNTRIQTMEDAKAPHAILYRKDLKKLFVVEGDVLETSGPRLFCNITGQNDVGVLDRNKGSRLATWPLPAGDKSNVAMAFDEANHRLFVSTRNPGKLIVLNSDSGKVISELPCVGMVDDAAYDAKYRRIYLAGDGYLDVVQQLDADHYSLLGRVEGSFRAKTGILVPELNRYNLAVPHHEGKDAEVRVYDIQP